jgi:hypothetical protein
MWWLILCMRRASATARGKAAPQLGRATTSPAESGGSGIPSWERTAVAGDLMRTTRRASFITAGYPDLRATRQAAGFPLQAALTRVGEDPNRD